jgi:hypothetical protein
MDNIPNIKRFARGDRVYVQAQRVWLILVAFVMSRSGTDARRTLTYGELAKKMGYDPKAGITLRRPLGIVGELCKRNNLPTLNSIVVNDVTGVPGDHVVLRDGRTPAQEQSGVLKQNWFEFRVPTTGTFRKVWNAMQDG